MSQLNDRISFANFKSFGPKLQSFSKKPITLVYGANSIGKSSALHAFLYLKAISRYKGLDPNHTTLFGDRIDFGKFENLVYKKEKNNHILYSLTIENKERIDKLFKAVKFEESFYKTIKKIDIDIQLEKKRFKVHEKYTVSVNNQEFYHVENGKMYISHPYRQHKDRIEFLNLLVGFRILRKYSAQYIGPLRYYPSRNDLKFNKTMFYITRTLEKLSSYMRKLMFGEAANFPGVFIEIELLSIKQTFKEKKFKKFIFDLYEFPFYLKPFVFLVRLFLFPFLGILTSGLSKMFTYAVFFETSVLDQSLRSMYRILVNPAYRENHKEVRSMWVDLYLDNEKREIMNNWLSNPSKLKSNYKLIKKDKELVFVDLRTSTEVHPREMGLGITQVLPILYAAKCMEDNDIFIEQPELHLHPAAQSELADVFIESIRKNNNDFMIETHSEHLLLRMMKRMRQTSEGTLEDESLKLTPDDICLLYVDSDGENTYILELELDEDGTLLDPWPGGFFEEGFNERFF